MDSRLCLGTVQFGLQYGINNRHGKPGREQVMAILDRALSSGITWIDTAAAYGDAETLLGDYGIAGQEVRVISKLMPNLIGDDCRNPEDVVEQEVRGSLQRLRADRLDGYLLHTPLYFYNRRIIAGLQRCREQGLVGHFGVSIYEEQHALDAAGSGLIDYIQVPYSVFDQRLDRTDFFKIARSNGVRVFARSAFLQGLIAMEAERIPEHLSIARGYLGDFDRIIERYGFNRIQAALLFSLTHPGIDQVVFGVDNLEQLIEDIDIARSEASFERCREELAGSFVNISRSIIFPSLWAKPPEGSGKKAGRRAAR
jgi:aryl-alcohol dehydrogenase-like predicted oxidoreductase